MMVAQPAYTISTRNDVQLQLSRIAFSPSAR
jgi:hypothetical protein